MKQQSLFNHQAIQSMTDTTVHPERTATKRKYGHNHWSYFQRLRHFVTSSPYLTPKIALEAVKDKEVQLQGLAKLNHYHTVYKRSLLKAVKAMRCYELKPKSERLRSHQSISKIARKYRVSRPTLYRGYYSKYNKTTSSWQ